MNRIALIPCALAVLLLSGCGGGSHGGGSGRLLLTVHWPQPSKLIPAASQSIKAVLTRGATTLDSKTLVRPSSGPWTTTVLFTDITPGQVTLTATAFPNPDYTGVSQATGSAPASIVAGQTTNVTVTMASTIDHLEITPPNPSVNVGANIQLTITARNAQNEVVLTSPAKVTWVSDATSIATVDLTGKVTGVAAGTAHITVTETESGKSANTTVTVTSGGGPGPLNGKIVFASSGGIYSMNPDGSNVVHLPNTIAGDGDPDVTKDGKRVLFVRNFTGGIYTMNADGSSLVKVTTGGTGEFLPAWSPDGTKIAVERTVSGNSAIIVMNADGSNQVNLTNDPSTAEEEPKWSPDGTKIIFARGDSDRIFVMNADGSNKVRVGTVSGAREPVFSPDGTKIAFHTLGGNFKIWVMNADGTNVVQLTPQGSPGDDRDACWSPDGTKIVFGSTRDGGTSEIYVMNADGSNQTRLTSNSVDDTVPKWR